jgi:hypothetical protein
MTKFSALIQDLGSVRLASMHILTTSLYLTVAPLPPKETATTNLRKTSANECSSL